MLEIALQLAARGWYVFPCWPKTKKPMTTNGFKDASDDYEVIRAWWTNTPDANIAIACGASGIAVLDVDHGLEDDAQAIAWIAAAQLPATYVVRTGRRPEIGLQFYFAGTMPDVGSFELNGCTGQIKSLGGYVMAAGSIHPSGEAYTVKNDLPLAPLPSIVAQLRKPVAAATNNSKVPKTKWNLPVHEGEDRTGFLLEQTGALRNLGCGKDAILARMIELNEDEEIIADPVSMDRLESTAANCAKYELPEQPPTVTIGSKPEEKKITDWRELFHTREQAENAPSIKFSIDGFLQDDGITGLSAPPGHRKTLMMLNITRSLLTGEPLFNKFKVNSQAERVVYLVPEVSLTPFVHRLRDFELIKHIGNRFFFRTLSASGKVSLSSPELREAIKGAHVFLDTVPRFIEGNENDAEDIRRLGEQLFELLGAGARSVVGAFHMPKGAKKLDYFDLEICVRGSSDLGALLTACWATRLQNEKEPYKCASYVECVKQRDFEACEPFELMSSERGIMAVHDGSLTVKLNGGLGGNRFATNRDGQEKHALAYIKQHPDLSLRDLEEGLKGIGIERKKDWISKKRKAVSADGGVCVGSP